jgi:hypothetical protein
VNSSNGAFSVNPIAGALAYQWSVDRPEAGSFIGTPTTTNAQFLINEGDDDAPSYSLRQKHKYVGKDFSV